MSDEDIEHMQKSLKATQIEVAKLKLAITTLAILLEPHIGNHVVLNIIRDMSND